ncbi:MAG: peptide ABC transporter substrate-binding protein [Crocinitomicaceae bacterium]
MKYILLIYIVLAGLFLVSCGETEPDVASLVAIGGKKYGGEFKFMSPEKINSLIPTESSNHYSSRIVSQIFDPLLRLNTLTMKVVPAVAESFSISDDALVYTFKIRKGIFFHKDNCFGDEPHELNAYDAKFTLDLACSGLDINHVDYLLVNRIKGAKDFNEATATKFDDKGVSGIVVIDDYTLQVHLISPFSGFENIITHPGLGVFPKEAYKKYGDNLYKHAVGSGPFTLEKMTEDKITLKRNANYWKKDELGNQLPFMSKVIVTYTNDKRHELLAFRESSIDLVLEVPVEEIEHILGTLLEAQEGKNVRHKVDSEKSLSMAYIAMACESSEFSNPDVRRAFNLAINRTEIVNTKLDGEGWVATNGFVPSMRNYPNEEIVGHVYNVLEAKELMAKAGYANGKNFPALDFYVNAVEGSSAYKLCKAVSEQLKANLNVDLNIKLCTMGERKAAVASGEAKIWRSGWIADYPDPESFLSLFYGGNITRFGSLNLFKFQSDEYDTLFESAISEVNPKKRTELLVKCDQMVIKQAALIPMLTEDHIVMINVRVRNFKSNSMESLNLTEVYIKEPRK